MVFYMKGEGKQGIFNLKGTGTRMLKGEYIMKLNERQCLTKATSSLDVLQ